MTAHPEKHAEALDSARNARVAPHKRHEAQAAKQERAKANEKGVDHDLTKIAQSRSLPRVSKFRVLIPPFEAAGTHNPVRSKSDGKASYPADPARQHC